MNDDDEIVKIKRSDLEALLDANTEAYNELDEIGNAANDVARAIAAAYRKLESVSGEISDFIIKDEE